MGATDGLTRVSTRGRAVRTVVAVGLCGGLLWGTLAGEDDHFPIAPFRMFSTRQRLDGQVSWYEVRLVAADGTETLVEGPDIGMRRAEIEGQRALLLERPELLCAIGAAATVDVDPVEVRLVKKGRPLEDGRLTGETVEEVVQTCVP